MEALKPRTVIIIALAAALLSACGSKPARESTDNSNSSSSASIPDWILQPPADSSNTLYGVGSAPIYGDAEATALQEATQNARLDLLSKLKVRVSGTISSNIQESRLNGKTSLQQTFSQNIRSDLAPVEYAGLNVEKRFKDGKTLYALASLDKTLAKQTLYREMDDLDEKLDRIATNQIETGSTLEQLGQLIPVAALIRQRQLLVERLALLSPAGPIPAVSDDHLALNDRLNQLLDSIVCSVNPVTDHAVSITPFLIQSLTKQGIRVGGDQKPDLVFNINSQGSDKQQNSRYYHLITANVQLAAGDGRVLDSFTETAKGVSGVQEMAWQKGAVNLAEEISNHLASTLTESLK